MEQTGRCLGGRYTLLQVIGQGGTSRVYLAEDEKLRCKRAIKEVRKDFRQDPLLWRKEWEMIRQLHHPYLVQMFDVVEEQESIYFVMEYVEGWTVKELLKQGRRFSEKQCIRLGKEICQVLFYLHTRNPPVIYRDLKPSNLMLREDGRIVLIDLGTAREYKNGSREDTICWGTPGYAAPEQLSGKAQSGCAADIYSFGVVLFEMVYGKDFSPKEAGKPIDGLGVVLERCTRMEPERRYFSCEEILKDLERVPFLGEKNRKRWERKKWQFTILLLMTGLLFVTSGLLHQQSGELLEKGYERWMEAGKRSTEEKQREECFRRAAKVNPWRGEAYEALLMEYRAQGFSKREYEQMVEFLEEVDEKGMSREFCLQQSGAYGAFAYQMGQACFFEWNGYGNKRCANPWLTAALETGELSEEEQEAARCLEKISSYYEELWRTMEYVEDIGSYVKFWEDLKELCRLATPQMKSLVQKEVVSQILSYGEQFAEAGISPQQQKQVLQEIQKETGEKETEFQKVITEGIEVMDLLEKGLKGNE